MPKPLTTKAWDRRFYFCVVGLYVVLAVAALASGITSWDEETDYLGIRTQIAHAAQLLHGDSPDYRDIHSNLEYYGTVSLLPAWIIWFLQQALLVGRLTLAQALFYPAAEHQLTGFYFISHLLLAIEFVGLSYAVIGIAKRVGAAFPWFAGGLTLLIPSLLGHSFVNTKDLPFALFYTAYTLSLVVRCDNDNFKSLSWSSLAAGLLINQKFVVILPVVISELILYICKRKQGLPLLSIARVPVLALCLALLLQPACWGISPWEFLNEAFRTFSKHEWGGCMWWSGTCVGVFHPEWSTWRYLLQWWSIKLPLVVSTLLIIRLVSIAIKARKKKSITLPNLPWRFVLLQILLIPLLAIMGQSNMYDADRHTLFVYPMLAIVSAAGLEDIASIKSSIISRIFLSGVVSLLLLVMILDDLVLNPYQIAYLNETGRYNHNHTTTALDYWGVSSKESLRQAQLNNTLPLSPVVHDSLNPLPLFIGLRQLAGHVSSDTSNQLRLQIRDSPAFKRDKECSEASRVTRTLITGQNLLMSRLMLCKNA